MFANKNKGTKRAIGLYVGLCKNLLMYAEITTNGAQKIMKFFW